MLAGLRPQMMYRIERFDPQTGVADDLGERMVGDDGLLALPERADANDWVFVAYSRSVGASADRPQ